MSNVREDFAVLDETNHKKMAAAVKAAMDADFKVEEKSLNDAERTFKRKSIAHFVKAKLSLEELRQGGAAASDTPAPDPADTVSEQPGDAQMAVDVVQAASGVEAEEDMNALKSLLEDDPQTEGSAESEAVVQASSANAVPENQTQISVPELEQEKNAAYDEGFAAGRAAALSELEEQRLEQLGVLKSIAERLQNEAAFDFDNVSQKVLETVYNLSSERCGLGLDANPEGFLAHVQKKLDQVQLLADHKKVFFNAEDLKSLQKFDEFEGIFNGVEVHQDRELKRGDVIVKVGGVEIRDTPFSDFAKQSADE
ncbi:FliH/SctL family protein [Rhodobacteraceae bacterium]|nr:FliH/SctL family protein [Paracoccaceae bacterium]